ncbi:hypothetical protein [Dongia sp.]|uniref:hypothetical protein n=1 Tax=Dongia sp. TaxID=1977262 RepID=UPI0035AFB7E3
MDGAPAVLASPPSNGIAHMSPRMKRRWLWLGLAALLSYGAAFAGIALDPYWDDNGVTAFIPWGERWRWAALFAPAFLIVIGPVLYAVRRLITPAPDARSR